MAEPIYPERARLNCLAETYSEIAMESYYNARMLYQRIKGNKYRAEMIYEIMELEKQVVMAVVFSAMCIESFFNDYAAACLGDAEFYENFDKLSTISKFQLIVKFILRRNVDKSRVYYSRLKQLVKNRDSYVHNKSSFANLPILSKEDLDKREECREEGYLSWKNDIDNAFKEAFDSLKTIRDIALFFDEHDSNIYAISRLFIPSGLLSGRQPYKEVVFKDLNIKADMPI